MHKHTSCCCRCDDRNVGRSRRTSELVSCGNAMPAGNALVPAAAATGRLVHHQRRRRWGTTDVVDVVGPPQWRFFPPGPRAAGRGNRNFIYFRVRTTASLLVRTSGARSLLLLWCASASNMASLLMLLRCEWGCCSGVPNVKCPFIARRVRA